MKRTSNWRIRTNQEPKELRKTPDLAADIKRRMLEWLVAYVRMDHTGMNKNILQNKPEGRRKAGRPTVR
jgi:hypothetical protein